MQSLKPQPFTVVYDIQKNKYYRINKLTGQIEPSSKTGKTPPKFNPLITGTDYEARSRRTHFNTIDIHKGDSPKASQNYLSIDHPISPKKSLHAISIAAYSTEPIQSRLSQKRDFVKATLMRKKKQSNSILQNHIQESRLSHKSKKVKTLQNDTVTLPKLQKRNSQYRLEPIRESVSIHIKVNPSVLNKPRNSQPNPDNSFVSYKSKPNPKDISFASSMNRLTVASGDISVSQSRMNWQKFQSKMRKYCQIEEQKLALNHFQPLENNQKSQKLQKFAQKSLLTSILDQSHITLNQTNINQSRFNQQHNQRKAVTRTQVQKNLEQLSKQKASLMLLSRKCQAQKNIFNQKDKIQFKKQSQPLMKVADLEEMVQQEKMKTQLQQQKEAFLSFYPGYAFKENPRLIKQQKDRKINLKKLEALYIENNEKKFGRIYRSESKDRII